MQEKTNKPINQSIIARHNIFEKTLYVLPDDMNNKHLSYNSVTRRNMYILLRGGKKIRRCCYRTTNQSIINLMVLCPSPWHYTTHNYIIMVLFSNDITSRSVLFLFYHCKSPKIMEEQLPELLLEKINQSPPSDQSSSRIQLNNNDDSLSIQIRKQICGFFSPANSTNN